MKTNLTTEAYLCKLKKVGMTDDQIALRLQLPKEEVVAMWERIVKRSEKLLESGAVSLQQKMHETCAQYKLLGDSLTIVAAQFGNFMSDEELQALITSDPVKTFNNLRTQAMVFRPFLMESPEAAIARIEKQHSDEIKSN